MSTKAERRAQARREREARERAEQASATRRRRLVQLGIAAALALVVVGAAILISRGGGGDDEVAATGDDAALASQGREVAALFEGIPQDGTVLGDPDAPATLIEFADLQCPFCADFAGDVLPTVVNDYVRAGRLKIDLQLLSFLGEDSVRAGRMAAAAGGQDLMWPFVELFYRNQGQENSGYATDDFLRRIGGAVPGLDVDRALAARETPAAGDVLQAATDQAEQLGATSTPAFYVRRGGRLRPVQVDQLTPEAFTTALDAALRG